MNAQFVYIICDYNTTISGVFDSYEKAIEAFKSNITFVYLKDAYRMLKIPMNKIGDFHETQYIVIRGIDII